ncbi:hypothetical protein [Paraburkholderia sp. BL23I1N1]|uniref:hypothetical protein n=2 Tax=unclassified Paraburkholderia TaxID=2615204 RepID=UPI0011C44B52|nr:hypothetical protein [Paraburkholderia sp. BL23I1N1]
MRTSSALLMLRDRGAWLELQTRSSAATRVLRGRRAVLALLQRLGAEHVRFDPPLPALLADALAATPTLLSAELAFNNTSCALSELP